MVSSASRSVSCRAFLVWIERNPLPSPTKGFVGHYSRKPDLASKSRGLQLIGFGALERGPRIFIEMRLYCALATPPTRVKTKRLPSSCVVVLRAKKAFTNDGIESATRVRLHAASKAIVNLSRPFPRHFHP